MVYNKDMATQILPESETTEFEDRVYTDPNLIVGQTDEFIENYRNTQQQNTNQINQQTQALGTAVPSNLGGLAGGTGYWTSRYQTPQTNTALQDLRTAAQATALNEALANEKAMWQKRYNDAYRAYQKRAWDNSKASTNSTSGSDDDNDDIETVASDDASTIEIDPLTSREGYYSVVDPYTGIVTDVNMATGENSQRGGYTDISISQMRNEKYTDEEGKTVYGWTYTLPSGKKVGIRYGKQKLVQGTDGNYYKYEDGTYTYLGR